MLIGGIVGLVLLAGIAGGGGWFAYTRYSKAKIEPTPFPSVPTSPQPSTVPVVADANQNGNSNSTPDPASDANSADANSNRVVTGTPKIIPKGAPAQTTKPSDAKTPPKPKGGDVRKGILP